MQVSGRKGTDYCDDLGQRWEIRPSGTQWLRHWLCTGRTEPESHTHLHGPRTQMEMSCSDRRPHPPRGLLPRSLHPLPGVSPSYLTTRFTSWPLAKFTFHFHWQNTVTSCSLDFHPLVAVSSLASFCGSCLHPLDTIL